MTITDHRTTPPAYIIFAIAGGLLFIAGGVITAMSANERAVLIASGIAFLTLGIYTVAVVVRYNRLVEENEQTTTDLTEVRSADQGLRTRLAYTLREPMSVIAGFADQLIEREDMDPDERLALLQEMRSNAREVDQILGDLSGHDHDPAHKAVTGVVLLDAELKSVVSTAVGNVEFESWLEPSRAWADAAQVRQILRTVVRIVTASDCTKVALKTDKRMERVTVTISGRCDLLSAAAVAALTGNTTTEDARTDQYLELKQAQALAGSMGGTLGYAQAMGVSHIVLELPAAPDEIGLTSTVPPRQPAIASTTPNEKQLEKVSITLGSATYLRPERPTAAIRFD